MTLRQFGGPVRQFGRARRAVAAIEFAIGASLLFAFIFGIINLGFLALTENGLQNGDPISKVRAGNYIPSSMQGNKPPSASSLACSSGSNNNLYNSVTAPNVGFSSGTGYAAQTDSIEVCGSGPPLQAIAVGGSILVSSVNSSNLWMSDWGAIAGLGVGEG